ncbi:hypothetical protein AgCh_028657 [Apium graveolens]
MGYPGEDESREEPYLVASGMAVYAALRNPSALDSRILRFLGGGEQCCLRYGRCPPVGPGLLPARKNRSLASRTSGGPVWRHTENIRSENADMSNEKSCEKHDHLPVEGFLRSVNLCRVNLD